METKKLSVLVIDDSSTACRILKFTIAREQHQVWTFQDPTLAIRAIITGEIPMPDLVFVDLLLPKMDGYAVIRYLREYAARKGIVHAALHIVVISRLNGLLEQLKARLAGANHYLVKPFDMQEIIDLLTRYAFPPLHE